MLIAKNTVATKASPDTIWNIWKDVENWKKWDHGIEFSHIEGPFDIGTKGTLKPKGGPVVPTVLTHVKPLNAFVAESRLFLARIIVSHDMTGIHVTHQIEMKGPLAFLFAFLIGRKMKKNLPQEMLAMVKLAEAYEKRD